MVRCPYTPYQMESGIDNGQTEEDRLFQNLEVNGNDGVRILVYSFFNKMATVGMTEYFCVAEI